MYHEVVLVVGGAGATSMLLDHPWLKHVDDFQSPAIKTVDFPSPNPEDLSFKA